MENPIAEPWTRYEDSIQWRIHHAYYQQRGAGAWLEHEIPYQSTSNIAAVKRHVRMFTALIAERAASPDSPTGDDGTSPLWVLEVGAGSGHFAANFLRALHVHAPAVAARTRYVASDYSSKNLHDLARSRHLTALIEAGRVIPAMYDVNLGGALRDPDGHPLVLDATFSMLVANYVCSAIAMTPLQKDHASWSELWVETRERSVESRLADESAEVLAVRPNSLAELPRTSAWQTLDSDLVAAFGPFHGQVIEAAAAAYDQATLFYPRRYFDFLRTFEPLTTDALLITCDYGTIRSSVMDGHFGRPPQHYGNSLGQSVMFTLFDSFAGVASCDVMRNQHELDSVHIAVVSRARLGAEVRAALDVGRLLGKNESDSLLDLAAAARHLALRDETLAALRCYQACIELDPDNARIRHDFADLALSDQRSQLALTHLLAGRALEPEGYDWDFLLGRAHYQCGSSEDALLAYERSLVIGPHPQTWLNLGAIHRDERRHEEALRCFREALLLDPTETRAITAIAALEALITESTSKKTGAK